MKVALTELAAFKIEELLNSLELKWSRRTRDKFLTKLIERLQLLSENYQSFPKSTIHPELRKLVVTKQTTVLYTVYENEIAVVTVFDSRQNPSKILEEIENYFG